MGTKSTGWRERLRSRWEEGIRHKVTPLGAMMVALLLASGVLSFTTSQNVFFLLFSLLLASILISSFVNRLMLAGLEVRLDLPPHPLAKEPLACQLTLENRKSWLASFALEVVVPGGARFSVPCVPGNKTVVLGVTMHWEQRGIPAPVMVELSTRFPFGFSVRRARVLAPVSRAVYPSIAGQPGFDEILAAVAQRAAGMSGPNDPEFSHLREYVDGDDWRRIAWGKSARGGDWIVKATQSHSDELLRLWFDCGSPELERLVEVAAFLVWQLSFQQAKFVFQAGGAEIAVLDRNDAYTVLKLLAVVKQEAAEVPYDDSNLFILSLRSGYLHLPGAGGGAQNGAAGADERHGF
ncbi:DUF58 domain-containing protein [Bryobacter aggregatus]|uniref:DUF58 domain-containing protein n=1 Tax=Bryobacter aggregatus TaxID=360054 RepID=UPI0004E27233|nr:DUF58 domain-containing protein [Bryobacter aggregatus]